jgi:hypothetical protein
MAHYLISYDLHNQRHYQPVWDGLNSIGAVRLLESLWLVERLNTNPGNLAAWLKQLADSDDSVAVIELKPGSDWASRQAKTAGATWMQNHIKAY